MRFRTVLIAGLTSAFCVLAALPAGSTANTHLRSKLLTLSNFPTGWTVHDPTSGGGAVSGGCLAGVKHAPDSEIKVTAAFENGQFPQFEEELVSGHAGGEAYNRINRVLARCRHFSIAADGQTFTATVGAMSFPRVGKESNAYQVRFPVDGTNFAADFILFRVGSLAGLVEYADIGQPDPRQVQAFVTEAVNKIEGKPTVTPTII
jgi:hypothetical protein